jgi:hypothetical protein
LANRQMAQRGRWMVDELSAPVWNPDPTWRIGQAAPPSSTSPWKRGIELTTKNRFERQYPPHGAHGSGTGIVVPKDIPMLAHYLRNYDPLVSEHLLWAYASRTSAHQNEGDEPYWQAATLKKVEGNSGTNPHLRSRKYTGHGLVLRAGVDTPEELSVHLDQVDQGTNYRWGDNGEGSSGVLYFFANGQPWTGHEQENTGDHTTDDATGITTFAVLHNHEWHGSAIADDGALSMGRSLAPGESRLDHVLRSGQCAHLPWRVWPLLGKADRRRWQCLLPAAGPRQHPDRSLEERRVEDDPDGGIAASSARRPAGPEPQAVYRAGVVRGLSPWRSGGRWMLSNEEREKWRPVCPDR